jgi:ParB-like chromosome segregation protein Spo0J
MQLELKQLHIDGGTQPRVAIHEETVAEYAEALREGIKFPPVIAFHDGVLYWLADGFHRYHAHRHAGLDKIEVDVREGSLRDAILFSVGANAEHGLRRTAEDKRKAILTLLTHELAKVGDDGKRWSDNAIAKRCRVSHSTVAKYRQEAEASAHTCQMASMDTESPDERRFVHHKTGRPTTMKTGKIGRSRSQNPTSATADKSTVKRCKFHAEDGPVPMRVINLPLKNPEQAALSLISVYGEEYMRKVNAKLNQVFQNERKG